MGAYHFSGTVLYLIYPKIHQKYIKNTSKHNKKHQKTPKYNKNTPKNTKKHQKTHENTTNHQKLTSFLSFLSCLSFLIFWFFEFLDFFWFFWIFEFFGGFVKESPLDLFRNLHSLYCFRNLHWIWSGSPIYPYVWFMFVSSMLIYDLWGGAKTPKSGSRKSTFPVFSWKKWEFFFRSITEMLVPTNIFHHNMS